MKGESQLLNTAGLSPLCIYAKQISCKNFPKTTKEFQKGVIGSFIKSLNMAIEDGVSDRKINSLLEDVNKALQKSGYQIIYERDGSNSYLIKLK